MKKEEIQVITAIAEPNETATIIGDETFTKKLLAEFHKKNVWRKLDTLSQTLGVDPQQLRQWLDDMPGVLRKCGKGDGAFFYCWEERIESPKEKPQTVSKGKLLQRPNTREEDRYALGMLHMIFFSFHRILKTYALEISQVDAEAFNNLSTSLDKLEAGLILFSAKSGATMEKLPKF